MEDYDGQLSGAVLHGADLQERYSKLLTLIRQMQSMMVRYLEPGDYVRADGCEMPPWHRDTAFAQDMVEILDSSEMIEAMGGVDET